MNIRLKHILLSAFLLVSYAAMAQTPHVTVGGNVFGGGNKANVAGSTTVLIDQNGAVVTGDVYGGGALAHVNSADGTNATANKTDSVTLKQGTVRNVYGGGLGQKNGVNGATSDIEAKVFGPVMVIIEGGTVTNNVYGCNNLNGAPQDVDTVKIVGGTVTYDVFGGGNLANNSVSPVVNIEGGTVGQDVYGGGALANVGGSTVNVLGGTVTRNVYGGGLGQKQIGNDPATAIAAEVNGVVTVNIGSGTENTTTHFANNDVSGSATIGGSVFGCNNSNGTPTDNVFVNIWQTNRTANQETSGTGYALSQVFGGGNQANYEPASTGKKATVHIWTCDNTIQYVYGGGNAANLGTSGVNSATDVIIDGGRIEWVFGGGNGKSTPTFTNPGANINGNTNITFHAGDLTYIFGGSNEKGNVSGAKTVDILSDGSCLYDNHIAELYGGSNMAPTNGDVSLTMGCPEHICAIDAIYGGSRNADISGDVTLTIIGGQYDKVFGGNNIGGTISGNVTLNLYGGTINSAYGGNNESGAINGTITVNVLDDESKNGSNNLTCPLILHNVYGGGFDAPYNPSIIGDYPEVNIIHGTVSLKAETTGGTTTYTGGNVFGGGYGTTAVVKSNPKVRVGYDATMSSYTTGHPITNAANFIAVVENNVFGGGDMAAVAGSTLVTLQHGNSTVANLFGGGNQASVGNATVNVAGGAVSTGVYGGCNVSGSVGGSISPYAATLNTTTNTLSQPNSAGTAINYNGTVGVNVTDGTIGVSGTPANVLGGGYGNGTSTTGDVTVEINGSNAVVWGDVYGGSAKGHVNDAAADKTNVTLTAGTIHGDLYGGGLGDASNAATVYGAVKVTVNGGTVTNVFGCNNVNGAPQSAVQVDINETTANTMHVTNVFGGGNLAQYTGNPAVNIINGTVSQNVYGGGKGELVNSTSVNHGVKGKVTGNPQVTIGDNDNAHTAHVTGDVYGGGDAANVDGTPVVVVNDCNTTIGYLYGGGNAADVTNANVTVNGGTITQAYGGGHGDKNVTSEPLKYADVNGDVVFNVYGGTIAQVFAGSNSKGSITGSSTLTVNKSAAANACDMFIGEVYGGGNEAAGNAGTITIGCTGAWTDTGTNNHTNHNSTNNRIGYELEGIGTVYGGANKADIGTSSTSSDISVKINKGIVENVFGGNNLSGTIYGTIQVEIDSTGTCDWYVGNVYGGGNQAAYGTANNNYPVVNIKKGLVSGDVFGGGLGVAGNPNKGKVTGNPQVTVNAAKARVNGGVYGGGSLASTEGNPLVTLTEGALTKVFGGGKAADVDGAPTVNINGGTVSAGVYGGCDSQGNVTGNIIVNITGDNTNQTTIGTQANLNNGTLANVHGGGYGENTTTSGNVTVNFGTLDINTHSDYPKLFGDIYGGSGFGEVNHDANNKTTVNVLNGKLETKRTSGTTANNQTYYIYTGGNVFGGGLGRKADATANPPVTAAVAKVNGKVEVNIGTAPNLRSNTLDPVNDTCIGYAVIGGNVYGCNNTNGSPQDDVTVNIYRTYRTTAQEINYTPGSGENPEYALANVFGGGNEANFMVSSKTISVNIMSCYNTIQRVFGGGNAASAPNIHTLIQGGRFAEVFGGGNGERGAQYAADVTGNVALEIHGGSVGEFYVGSNQHGSISGTSNVTVDQSSGCEEIAITEFYCGGKYADFIGDINAEITCSQGLNVTYLYGGCKEAHVKAGNGGSGNVHLVVKGGTYDYIFGGSKGTTTKGADIQGNVLLEVYGGTVNKAIFGGSNVQGAIGGTITVNVEDKFPDDACALEVSTADVYGGGNKADYPGVPSEGSPLTGPITHTSPYNYPAVNIKNATVKNVFGGGLNAKVTGNPQIKIKKGSKILGNVYGGGNLGEVKGDPKVIVNGKME